MQTANTAPGQIATLIVPADTAWNDGGIVAAPLPVPPREAVTPQTIAAIARVLRSKEPAMLILSGQALSEAGLAAANRIAYASGANTAHADASAAHGARPRPRAGGPHPLRGGQCRQGA